MHHRTFLFCFQIAIVICFFCQNTPTCADQSSPIAFLETDSYDFGSEYEGNEVIHDFVIRNTGLTDLEIKDVHSG